MAIPGVEICGKAQFLHGFGRNYGIFRSASSELSLTSLFLCLMAMFSFLRNIFFKHCLDRVAQWDSKSLIESEGLGENPNNVLDRAF